MKDILTPSQKTEARRQMLIKAVSNPPLPLWMEADERLKFIQACKKQSRELGVQ